LEPAIFERLRNSSLNKFIDPKNYGGLSLAGYPRPSETRSQHLRVGLNRTETLNKYHKGPYEAIASLAPVAYSGSRTYCK